MNNMMIPARKLHRMLVLIISFLALVMAVTGGMMKLGIGGVIPRYIHNQVSLGFSVVLILMMFTGLYMYIYPIMRKR